MSRPKVFFKTFGCRTNLVDTQIMKENLTSFEVSEREEECGLVVVNSCTVTNGADSGVRSYVRRLHREGKRVYLTGCGVKQGEHLLRERAVWGVFDHAHKESLDSLLQQDEGFALYGSPDHLDSTVITQFSEKSRAFIKIQEGCDFRCSYCIIPSVRGASRSLPVSLILSQVRALSERGFSEFVLTGTNVGSYGRGEGSSIAQLIKAIAGIDGVRRVRVGSLEPSQVDAEFLELLDAPFMARHLHIALQHTSPFMLRLMNRPHDPERDLELFLRLSKEGYALGTDFIVGHPRESEEVWEEGLERFLAFPLTHLHAFIYSPREGTPSSRMEGRILGDVAKERLTKLKEIVSLNNRRFRENRQSLSVLVESGEDRVYQGLDQFFNRLEIRSERELRGRWVSIEKYRVGEEKNYAEIE